MLKTYIDGETMIFRKDFKDRASYSTTLSKKTKDGEWENGFIPVQFKKDVFVHNKTKINIKNAWLTFYKDKDGKTVPLIFISEFEELEKPEEPKLPDGITEFAALDDDDCPF